MATHSSIVPGESRGGETWWATVYGSKGQTTLSDIAAAAAKGAAVEPLL